MKLLDTENLKRWGSETASAMEGDFGITSYTKEEASIHGITTFPSETVEILKGKAPSWPDFRLKDGNEKYSYYVWTDGNNKLQAFYSLDGFGLAPCGHKAVFQILDDSSCSWRLCEKFKSKADFSQVTAIILGIAQEHASTNDRCNGITCRYISEILNKDANNTNNQ